MGWIEIKDANDIKHLLDYFGNFHDGCFREIHLWNSYFVTDELSMCCGDNSLNGNILFQRQYEKPSTIEICFNEIQSIYVNSPRAGIWQSIFGVTLLYNDGVFYFADEENWDTNNPEFNGSVWIIAKRIKWRDTSEWMGDKLRYGYHEIKLPAP